MTDKLKTAKSKTKIILKKKQRKPIISDTIEDKIKSYEKKFFNKLAKFENLNNPDRAELIKTLRIYYDKDSSDDIKECKQNINKLNNDIIKLNNEIENIQILKDDVNIGKKNTILYRKIFELHIDIIKDIIEHHNEKIRIKEISLFPNKLSNNEYTYYPNTNNPQFSKIISNKKEFSTCKSSAKNNIKKYEKNTPFLKSNTQEFAKRFISKYTPYNSILLWHGVGVGKTCTAIGIAENFRAGIFNKYGKMKQIQILLPNITLKENWKNEIINLEKEKMKHKNKNKNNLDKFSNKQCTNDIYVSKLGLSNKKVFENDELLIKQRNKIINQYYKFTTYGSLHGFIERHSKKESSISSYNQRELIKFIKKYYSNTVFIMDEIHITRYNDQSSKISRNYLELIARYAENSKMILLSATPMFNKPSEIIWILNLMLWNEKRAPIIKPSLFKNITDFSIDNFDDDISYDDNSLDSLSIEDTTLSDDDIKLLKKKSRGLVSYVRSENPFEYPLKLAPKINKAADGPGGIKYPDTGKLVFYKNIMDNEQYKIFTDSEYPEYKGVVSRNSRWRQASNIIYPINKDINNDLSDDLLEADVKLDPVSNEAFSAYFPKKGNKIDTGKDSGLGFLDEKNIGKISCKFKNIFELIKKSKGIIFIYSNFKAFGIKAFAYFLEYNGFLRYTSSGNKNYLSDRHLKKNFDAETGKITKLSSKTPTEYKQGNYIYLDGETNKIELSKLVEKVIEEENKDGHNIKIILGSQAVSQGISFKNVRQIHLLDPWFNLNQQTQAAGRGIRKMSHAMLDKKQRNVTLFRHIAIFNPTNTPLDKESYDYLMYKLAYKKFEGFSKIENILKKNAVDCYLNKFINIFKQSDYDGDWIDVNPLAEREIENSYGDSQNQIIEDVDNSIMCNLNKCDYTCFPEEEPNPISLDSINMDTFNINFYNDIIFFIKNDIKKKFNKNYVVTLKELLIEFKKTIKIENEEVLESLILLALKSILTNNETIYDKFNNSGIIIHTPPYFVFQPEHIKDLKATMKYRYLYSNYKNDHMKILNTKSSKKTPNKKVNKKPKKYNKEFMLGYFENLFNEHTSLTNYIKNLIDNETLQTSDAMNVLIKNLQGVYNNTSLKGVYEKSLITSGDTNIWGIFNITNVQITRYKIFDYIESNLSISDKKKELFIALLIFTNISPIDQSDQESKILNDDYIPYISKLKEVIDILYNGKNLTITSNVTDNLFSIYPTDTLLLWIDRGTSSKKTPIKEYYYYKDSKVIRNTSLDKIKKLGFNENMIPKQFVNTSKYFGFYGISSSGSVFKTIDNANGSNQGKQKKSGIQCKDGGTLKKPDRLELLFNIWTQLFENQIIINEFKKIPILINKGKGMTVTDICILIKFSIIHIEYFLRGHKKNNDLFIKKNNRFIINYNEYQFLTI